MTTALGTPITGSLKRIREYYLNNNAPAFPSPITTDRAAAVRVDGCRPYRAILRIECYEPGGRRVPTLE